MGEVMSDTDPAPPMDEEQLELPFPEDPPWRSPLEGEDLGLPNPGHLERNPPR